MQEKVLGNDRSHQLGKNIPEVDLSLLSFARRNVCNAIFRKKKILKGKAVSITENLTKKRITEMKIA